MVECTQTIPLPWGGREVVYKRLSVKVHQTQVKGKKHGMTQNHKQFKTAPPRYITFIFLSYWVAYNKKGMH